MEHVQLPFLPCTKGPGFTAVQECTQDTSSIDLDLGMCRQLFVKPYSLCESRRYFYSHGNKIDKGWVSFSLFRENIFMCINNVLRAK